MKLAEIAAKPKLVEITLDDKETVDEFGEPLQFWTWDRQPMNVFMKLATVDNQNYGSIIDAVKMLVLDEKGQPILKEDQVLPTKLMLRVISKVVEGLGKL